MHKRMLTSKQKGLKLTGIGFSLALILFGILIGIYKKYEDDPDATKIIDTSGIVIILLVSVLYWLYFTQVECISYNLAALWPRLAFRYALGGGIFFAVFKRMVKTENPETPGFLVQVEDYYPLLVLGLIFGNYMFIFMETMAMTENKNCVIKLENL